MIPESSRQSKYFLITNIGTALALPSVADYPRHMVLAQQLLASECYYTFVEKLILRGHTVILDNGAHEGKMCSIPAYLRLIKRLRPTVAVMPDLIGRCGKCSLRLSLACAWATKKITHGNTRSMVAVQGKDPGDVIRTYQYAYNNTDDSVLIGYGQSYLQFAHSDYERHSEGVRFDLISRTHARGRAFHILGGRWNPLSIQGRPWRPYVFGLDSVKPLRRALSPTGYIDAAPEARLSLLSMDVPDEHKLWLEVSTFVGLYGLHYGK